MRIDSAVTRRPAVRGEPVSPTSPVARPDRRAPAAPSAGHAAPARLAVIVVVVAGTAGGHPAPALHGGGLGVTLALVVFAASLAVAIGDAFVRAPARGSGGGDRGDGRRRVALAALQPHGATGLAGGARCGWRSPGCRWRSGGDRRAMTVALGVDRGARGGSSAAVLASTLLCALLGLIAYFLKQARESQDRTEVLLAQLEDARDEQTRAAAIAERGRIASELHDVLAHSLSGAAIQLQGARLLAEREQATAKMREAIDRAGELVKDGLADARQAVGALRGERAARASTSSRSLVDSFSADMNVEVTLRVEAAPANAARRRGPRPLPRCAGGADQRRSLRARRDHHRRPELRHRIDTTLSVEDRLPRLRPRPGSTWATSAADGDSAGMRERLERAGGSMQAGPTDTGWRVELEVPA